MWRWDFPDRSAPLWSSAPSSSIAEALERGETVKLSGFGVFQVREKRARMGRNPKTGEPAAIDPRRVISFRASQVMKARVDGAGGTVVLDHEAA